MAHDTVLGFPLSPTQRRLWQLGQDGSVHNSVVVLRHPGKAQVEQIAARLLAAVRHHELLGAAFLLQSGLRFPTQVAGTQAPQLTSCTGDGEAARSLAQKELCTPFALATGPLLRVTLVVGENEYRLVLVAPALAADAGSLSVLGQELLGGPGRDAFAYSKIAAWQNQLQSEPEPLAVEFWSRAPALAPVLLPFFAGGGAFQPRALTLATPRLAPELLIVRFARLVARLARVPNLVLGVTESGRDLEELAYVQGHLAKTFAVQVDSEVDEGAAVSALTRYLGEARDFVDHFQPSADGPAPQVGVEIVPELADAAAVSREYALDAAERFWIKLCLQPGAGTAELLYDASHLDDASALVLRELVLSAFVDRPLESTPIAGVTRAVPPTDVLTRFYDCAARSPHAPALLRRGIAP